MKDIEIWKSVGIVKGVNFTGLYEVSNFGRVRSLDRLCEHIDGRKRHLKGKILKLLPNGKGYLMVSLHKNNLAIQVQVHYLVLQTFKPNPDPKIYTEINHIDENKRNNYLNNLEWCTRQYNNTYGTKIERTAKSHQKPVILLDLQRNFIKKFDSVKDAAEFLGCTPRNISVCIKKQMKVLKRYRCEYLQK